MDVKLDSSRSLGSGAGSGSDSGLSSAATSRPSSQLSTSRPSVKFASPRTLVMSFPHQTASESADPSATPTPASTSAPSSSRLPVASSSSSHTAAAHFEHELALQRREFEHRFADFQQLMSAEQAVADCAAYREQLAAMSEQLAVQELFMACQRVELAHFYQQRQREEQQRVWEMQQVQERLRLESERQDGQDEQRGRMDSAASVASDLSAASDVQLLTSSPTATSPQLTRPSRPATPSSALSSVSSVLDAAVSAHSSARPSALQSVNASPFAVRPFSSSSSTSPSAFRPPSASLLSPRRVASAATANHSAFASPFVSSAHRSASVLSALSHSSSSSYAPSAAAGPYPFFSSAASVASPLSQSSPEPALADVLAMTESLLAQTDESLQAERVRTEMLQSTIADLQRRAAATSRQYDADTGEIREQLRIRALVCSKQEEALHRLTFENHSLVQQIIQLQQQLHSHSHSHSQQQPSHPARAMQPSSHHLPAASPALPSSTVHPAAAVRDKSGLLFPPILSAIASSSVGAGRLSKSRFVQSPPAASLSAGFHTDSSHASPISTAALGWSQGWKSYTTDANSGTTQLDESKEQMSLSSNEHTTDSHDAATARTALLLFPALQPHSRAGNDSSNDEGEQPQQPQQLSEDAEIVIASSPLALTAPSPLHFTAAPTAAEAQPAADAAIPTASSAISSSRQSLVHRHTATLQPPPTQPSPEQLHLHDHSHRPPLPPPDTQPARVPALLRSRAAKAAATLTVTGLADTLAVQATSFTKGPPTAMRSAYGEQQQQHEEEEQQRDRAGGAWSDHAGPQHRTAVASAAADESEQGWVVDAASGVAG